MTKTNIENITPTPALLTDPETYKANVRSRYIHESASRRHRDRTPRAGHNIFSGLSELSATTRILLGAGGAAVALTGAYEAPAAARMLEQGATRAVDFVIPSRDVHTLKTPDGKNYQVYTGSYHR
ncbi:MAG TPA: hypothetical protein VG964_01315 [Candidatus Saccharimonadales bacterium]|nr:hypothetical protein [Candidatus Saccharimonadales bacterium]